MKKKELLLVRLRVKFFCYLQKNLTLFITKNKLFEDRNKMHEDNFHDVLSELVQFYHSRSKKEQARYGITLSQSSCLRSLWKNKCMNMSTLAHELSLSLSTTTGVVDQLVKKSFVKRVSDSKDRRILYIQLTKKGKKLYGIMNKQFQRQLNAVWKDRKKSEKKLLLCFLQETTQAIKQWRKHQNVGNSIGHMKHFQWN